MMKFFALVFWLTIALAAPASAGPVLPAVAAVGAWVSSTLAAGGLGSILLRLAGGLILSRLQSLFVKKPKTPTSGIKTNVTQTGGVNPQSFILGVYATAGTHVAPPMSQDRNGAPNQWLHYIIDLGDKPQGALRKTWIDGVEANFDGAFYEGYGNLATDSHLIGESGGARALRKYYDGTQTTADSQLLADFASYPERPWSADMALRGVPYVVITFSAERTVFQGFPQVKFETEGVALYDPREDTDLGGTGAHDWADEATWEQTLNPQQMIYNIIRGITLPDGSVWGIGAEAADLPASNWFAALNDCDEAVDLEGGGTEPRYRAGYEVTVDQEPLAVVEELLKACGGEIVEFGGYWHTQVGAPASASLFITDDDLIITANRDLDPFLGLNETTNAVTATYPDINGSWEVADAEPRYDEDWEAEDQGRRLTTSLDLPAVPYDTQVRRLMREIALDARRMRSHVITLPPDALHILPLQTISWTSARNGYTGKTFEVTRKIIDPATLNSTLALRERDAADYADNSADDAIVPTPPSGGTVIPQLIGTPGWAVAAVIGVDGSDNDRRVGIRQTWDTDIQIAGVSWQVRLSGTTDLTHSGTISDVQSGEAIVWDGVLPATAYEVRSRAVSNREALWSNWVEVTTADVALGVDDLSDAFFEAVAADAATDAAAQIVTYDVATVQPIVAGFELDIQRRIAEASDASTELDKINDYLIWLSGRQTSQQQLLTGAGIYVDEATGNIRLSAFDNAEEKISDLSIELDAQASQIELRATYADVNNAIAAQVLDPFELSALDDIQVQINDVSVALDAAEAAIDLRATSVTVGGIETRVTTAENEIDALEGEIVNKVSTTDFDAVETRLSTAESTLSTIDGAEITSTVIQTRQLTDAIDEEAIHDLGDLLYQYQSRNVTRTDIAFVDTSIRAEITDDRIATATARAELAAQIDANAALILSEQTARATEDAALALDITQLETDLTTTDSVVSGHTTAISSLQTTQTAQGSAITQAASDITQLETDLTTTDGVVSGHTTAISTLQTTQTAQGDTITAQASSITSLETTVGGHTTTLTEYGTSIDGIEAQYGVTINANDRVTGFSLIGGGASTSFTVQADKFAIVSPDDTVSAVPFVAYTTETVVGGVTIPAGTVVMDNVLIRDLSAISAQLGSFKTSATGERTEIDDDGIRIYYPSGQLAGVFGEIP